MAHPTRAPIRPYTQAACTPTAELPRPSATRAPKAPQKPPKAPARAPQPRHPMPAPILRPALAMLAQAQTPADGTTSHSSTGIHNMPHQMLCTYLLHYGNHARLVLAFYEFIQCAALLYIYVQRIAIAAHTSPVSPQ